MGFSTAVGTHFKFVAKPMHGCSGVVECEVLESREPSLLRYSWVGDEGDDVTMVTYQINRHLDPNRENAHKNRVL